MYINKISLNVVHWYRANFNVMLLPYMALYCVNLRFATTRLLDRSELVINVVLITPDSSLNSNFRPLTEKSKTILFIKKPNNRRWLLTPLNFNIKIQILICLSLYVFNRRSGENLLKCQLDSSCVIMSLFLMTTLFYKAVLLRGEIWRWSLSGLIEIDVQSTLCKTEIFGTRT